MVARMRGGHISASVKARLGFFLAITPVESGLARDGVLYI